MYAHRAKPRVFIWSLAALVVIMFDLLAGRSVLASAVGVTPVKTITENRLEAFFEFLQDYKTFCGHYPLNVDEYKHLFQARKVEELAPCPKFSEVVKRFKKRKGEGVRRLQDGWGEPMSYSSDGKMFRLEASHGYSITDRTTAKKDGLHWDNANPPPDGPPSRPEPGGAAVPLSPNEIRNIKRMQNPNHQD